MGNQPFNVIVILFWLATMSWLVVAKILPPLRVGEPPNYASILEHSHDEPPASWTIEMQGRTIGWAANKIVRGTDGISQFYSRVYLDGLPLEELAPGWLASVLKPVFSEIREMDVDKRSRFAVDPLGRLSEFESRVRLADVTDAIRVQGKIDGSTLHLTVTSGEISARLTRSLSPNALMGDELSPQARMPGLRVGQTWTVPLYSPFRAATSPLEILQATVEREDRFHWDGQTVNTRMIVYRGDPGSGLAGDEPRGRMWVRDDGVVLRQEVSVFKSLVQFERLPAGRAEAIWKALGDDWSQAIPAELARRLLERLRGGAPSGEGEAAAPDVP
ncbi:MAG: hypothetical protein WD063_05865 [Pirellulales bacterium]